MDGYGTETPPNGEKYEGSWYKNKKHGIGEFRLANGNISKAALQMAREMAWA